MPLNPHLLRHLQAIRAERDRYVQHAAFVTVRQMRQERDAAQSLHPAPRLEARGVSRDQPKGRDA